MRLSRTFAVPTMLATLALVLATRDTTAQVGTIAKPQVVPPPATLPKPVTGVVVPKVPAPAGAAASPLFSACERASLRTKPLACNTRRTWELRKRHAKRR